jgi:nicotinate-nucleotide pyrophosphorylase (carboxylating)
MMSEQPLQIFISQALQEDIGAGDHSTRASIPIGTRGKAALKIEAAGILAGMDVR